jgi:TRAP-type C4-dicarboxylate transport system permease small subunit
MVNKAENPIRTIPGLSRVNAALLLACRWVSIVLVALIAIVVIAAVFWRYVLNNSLAWAEDLAKFLMVWLAFIGAPLGFRHGAHVAISLVPARAPEVLKRVARAVVHLVVLSLMAVLTWYAWIFAWNGRTQVALTVGDVSMFWIFVCMPIGAALMALVALEALLVTLLGGEEPAVGGDDLISTQGM